MRVDHRICSTICGTPVQAISDHKNLTELTGGVREGQNLPQNGLNLALELSRGPLNWSMTPEMDPKWSAQLPLNDLSPFPDLLKHDSPYI